MGSGQQQQQQADAQRQIKRFRSVPRHSTPLPQMVNGLNKDGQFLWTFDLFLLSAIVDKDADKVKEGTHKVDPI